MKELVRKHEIYSSNGVARKVRILREPGDLLEGVHRFMKVPLVLERDKNWQFSVEKRIDDTADIPWFRAKAKCDEEEPFYYYDFAVEDEEMKDRFIAAAEAFSGEEVKEVQ